MTPDLNEFEKKRLEMQAVLDGAKSQSERNKLGQFATPTVLAYDVMKAALAYLPPNSGVRFFDPAFGTGSFYSALLRVLPLARLESAVGYEIDHHYGAPSQGLWSGTAFELRLADFTRQKPPLLLKPNLLVCNPPYVRHHHLETTEKRRLQEDVTRLTGYDLSGLAGLYCYFLLLSQAWMEEGGVAAWLIPSEFMDVNYGKHVKQFLLDRVTLLRIHRFDSADVQFEDALVSSAVVFFRNAKPQVDHKTTFSVGGSVCHPRYSETVDCGALLRLRKWTKLPDHTPRPTVENKGTLADLFKIKRGLATGCNSFFVLTLEEVQANGIPRCFLKPILPSPRKLTSDQVFAQANSDPRLQLPLFLLDCPLSEEEIKAEYEALWSYLCKGLEKGVNKGYICRHRVPWYSQENRPAAPFLCTYMGRPTQKSRTPFRFILNHSNATASNVYLMLYPKPPLQKALAADPDLKEKVWKALSSIGPAVLTGEGRLYGGGLHKMEPKELANVPANVVLDALPHGYTPPVQADLFGNW